MGGDSARSRRAILILTAIAGCLTISGAAVNTNVLADTCEFGSPASVQDVRGYAFIGTLTAIRPLGVKRYVFDVETILAKPAGAQVPGYRAGGTLTIHSEQCIGVYRLVKNGRYLLSTVDIEGAPMKSSAVWRLYGNDAHLVRMSRQPGALELANADTVDEAVALVAPDAVLPPTDIVIAVGPESISVRNQAGTWGKTAQSSPYSRPLPWYPPA